MGRGKQTYLSALAVHLSHAGRCGGYSTYCGFMAIRGLRICCVSYDTSHYPGLVVMKLPLSRNARGSIYINWLWLRRLDQWAWRVRHRGRKA
jgi:hypothetical protein